MSKGKETDLFTPRSRRRSETGTRLLLNPDS